MGYDVEKRFNTLDIENVNVGINDFDRTDKEKNKVYIIKSKLDVLVLCDAYTVADKKSKCMNDHMGAVKYTSDL
ncbi:hypothetical protein LGK95_10385 [Clostridium algoriphilum]|uniref:hypothetical protein n=1 Tax=Clostridium algoriphilum TaxID=198347 RepID=UPI001CF5E98B|nr:hypothetical protein [Clostridium algoriphilum]MCB2293927.1 hypothetical protein [Clostridium algoriphilum]